MSRMEMAHVVVRAINQVGENDYDFLYLAIKNGLISGKENGKLDPDGKITGADVLTVVDRINKVRSGETLEIWHNYERAINYS